MLTANDAQLRLDCRIVFERHSTGRRLDGLNSIVAKVVSSFAPAIWRLVTNRRILLFVCLALSNFAVEVMLEPESILAQGDTGRSSSIKPELPVEISVSDRAESLGFDAKRLGAIDRKLKKWVSNRDLAGCSVLILSKGEEAYFGRWGYRDLRKQSSVSRDTIFRIYSMTKPVTCIAAMQLVEQGKLELDSPVSDYLPEFANLKVLEKRGGDSVEVAPKRTMKVRDLFRHTSGLTYGFFGNTAIDKQYVANGVLITDLNIKGTVGKLAKIPLLYHPGTQFHYSVSTDVLGRVIEVVAQEPLDEYFENRIFRPLGMTDTFFTVPTEKQNRFAELYQANRSQGVVPASIIQSVRFLNQENKYFSGGGGLCSTIDDYMRFCQMLIDGGKANDQRILKEESLRQMFTNQLVKIENPPGRSFKYGLGFRVFPNGDYGWGGAAGTRFWVNPTDKTAVIFMTQILGQPQNYADAVRAISIKAMNK